MRDDSDMPNRSLLAVYADVDVRCVLPYAPNRARFGIGLNLPGGVARYAVDVAGARFLRDALDRALTDYEAKCGVQSAKRPFSDASGDVVLAVRDFAFAPGGRLRIHGPLSGQEYREAVVEPAVRSGRRVVVDLDGVLGYSSAFLEELFGALVRSMGWVSRAEFGTHVCIRSNVESWSVEAEGYVRDALAKQAGEGAHV